MILRAILWIFLVYMMYIFLFRFLIPVFRASRQMRNNIKNFQNQMQNQEELNQTQNPGFGTNNNGKEAPKPKAGDYIDFEEVKEKKPG